MPSPLPSPPTIEVLAFGLLMYLAGCITPWYYALERMRGAGRWLVDWLPYKEPPGATESGALADAVEQGEASPTSDDADD